jgi:hypothetical protein
MMSRVYGAPPTKWSDWEDSPTWDEFFASLELKEVQCNLFREKLMADKHLRLKETFRTYGSALPDNFWSMDCEQWTYPITLGVGWGDPVSDAVPIQDIVPQDRHVVRSALGKTYDLRSAMVHRGHYLHTTEVSLRAATAISASKPLPYTVLRAILVSMIRHEFNKRSARADLPDIEYETRT